MSTVIFKRQTNSKFQASYSLDKLSEIKIHTGIIYRKTEPPKVQANQLSPSVFFHDGHPDKNAWQHREQQRMHSFLYSLNTAFKVLKPDFHFQQAACSRETQKTNLKPHLAFKLSRIIIRQVFNIIRWKIVLDFFSIIPLPPEFKKKSIRREKIQFKCFNRPLMKKWYHDSMKQSSRNWSLIPNNSFLSWQSPEI